MNALDWKFFAIYCGWIAFEFMFIFFLYPETSGRTLEELAFCKFYISVVAFTSCANFLVLVFEDKELADQAVMAVEKQIHHEDIDDPTKQPVTYLEDITTKTA
jgi:hypothetical protein